MKKFLKLKNRILYYLCYGTCFLASLIFLTEQNRGCLIWFYQPEVPKKTIDFNIKDL